MQFFHIVTSHTVTGEGDNHDTKDSLSTGVVAAICGVLVLLLSVTATVIITIVVLVKKKFQKRSQEVSTKQPNNYIAV